MQRALWPLIPVRREKCDIDVQQFGFAFGAVGEKWQHGQFIKKFSYRLGRNGDELRVILLHGETP